MPRHDVAIYTPEAASYYDAAATAGAGGAERQTVLLARALADRGLRVAHVVGPVAEPVQTPVTLVRRPLAEGLRARSADVWQALGEADAQVQVIRRAQGTLGVAGVWARSRRRGLVFAGANDSDFTGSAFSGCRDPRRLMFEAGLRMVDAVVVQTDDQLRIAREHFPRLPQPVQVNSFVEPAAAARGAGEAFLWVSRLADYKRPLLYADLAEAVPEARFWMIATAVEAQWHQQTLAELRRRAAALPNLELLDQRPHTELQALIGRAVAMVNTSSYEGMPNTWLEGWALGVPALTLSFDPDGRIAAHGLGVAAGGNWEDFVAGARRLWEWRADRGGLGPAVRGYVADAHGEQVAQRWADVISRAATRGPRRR